MQCDCGVSTRPPQLVPLFRHINVQVDFRPECLDGGSAAGAFQAYFMSLMVRVDAAAAAQAFNFASDKTGLRSAFPDEPESVLIS
jgi:uncharacterized protein CbrC (UPF0167 family)